MHFKYGDLAKLKIKVVKVLGTGEQIKATIMV